MSLLNSLSNKKKIGSSLGERRLRICFCKAPEDEIEERKYQAAKEINLLEGYKVQLQNKCEELKREIWIEGKDRIIDTDFSESYRSIAIAQTKIQEASMAMSYVLSDPNISDYVKL